MLVTINVVTALFRILSFCSGKGKTVPVYVTNLCGRLEVYFLPILNFGTRWMYVVSVTPWLLDPEE